MSAYSLRAASPADDSGILALMGAPQPSTGLTLGFERAPSYFLSAQVSHEQPDIVVATLRNGQDDVVAVFNIGRSPMFVNGRRELVIYACDMRIAQAHRGGRVLHYVGRLLRERLGETGWYQTVVLSENQRSHSTFAKGGRGGFPVYHLHGKVVTSTLTSCPIPASSGHQVRAASGADVPAMNAFIEKMAAHYQFLPAYDFAGVLRGEPYFRGLAISDFQLVYRAGELVALGGLWRQNEFKQTRVLAYRPLLAFLRPSYNVWTRWRGGLHLPQVGGLIEYVVAHSPICAPDDLPAFGALLRALWKDLRASGGQALCLSLADNDPRREVLRHCRQHSITGHHFLASNHEEALPALSPSRTNYFECGRL